MGARETISLASRIGIVTVAKSNVSRIRWGYVIVGIILMLGVRATESIAAESSKLDPAGSEKGYPEEERPVGTLGDAEEDLNESFPQPGSLFPGLSVAKNPISRMSGSNPEVSDGRENVCFWG